MLSVVPAVALCAVVYARFIKRLSKDYQTALAEGSDAAQEALSSVRTVRSFAQEDKEAERYSNKVRPPENAWSHTRGQLWNGQGGAVLEQGAITRPRRRCASARPCGAADSPNAGSQPTCHRRLIAA